jgi:PAS domain S-box-containing protein
MASPEELGKAQALVSQQVDDFFDSSELTKAIDTEEFKHFLDYVPIAIMISKVLREQQRIVYVNKAFEILVRQSLEEVRERGWPILDLLKSEDDQAVTLGKALQNGDHYIGTFRLDAPKPLLVEAYASIIEDDEGKERYRIFAFIDVTERTRAQREEFSRRLRDKETLLWELQHRVKNNLQLITALIRIEARYKSNGESVGLERLAGRIEALQLLYRDLSPETIGQVVDLGHYLSQIAAAVMHTYGVDGIRLDLKVDHAPASINVAMPIGLIVNELMTNAFKYAFKGRQTGTITIRCLHEDEINYRVVVADEGVGLPKGTTWPMPGKLGSLIIQTLRENAKEVKVGVETAPEKGTRVTIDFQHKPSLPKLQ